jgi:hypothetical protein
MNELETALTEHDWGHNGCKTRPELDRLMQAHSDSVEAKALWEKHCPWSDTNGGFAAWSQQ